MLEWIKDLNRAILSREEQPRVKELEGLLSHGDLRSLSAWLDNNLKQIDRLFIIAFTTVIDDLLRQSTLESTQRLFYLDSVSLAILLGEFNLDEVWVDQLAQVVQVLEEDGVGPRVSTPKDAADMYKRVYNYRGCRLAERGDYAASIAHFNVTLSLDPHFAPAYCNRARAYLELNRLEEAWADCETMYSFDDKYPVGRATYQLVNALRKHKALQEEGTVAELAEEYGLLELLRGYDRPLKPREMYEARQGNPLELPELNVADATAEEFNHLGVVQVRSADFTGAIEAFNLAIQRKPGYDRAYFNRAQAYVHIGNYEKAVADFSFLIQQNPQDAHAKYFLAQVYEKWKREQGSEEISMDVALLNEIEQQVGKESANEQNKGTLLKEVDRLSRLLHQHQRALELLDNIKSEAIKTYASLPAHRHLQQAAIMERQGRLVEAVHYYSQALEMLSGTRDKTTLATCLEGLGRSQKAQGQMKDARDHLMQVLDLSIERNEDIAEERLYHQLGQLEEEDGHFHEAQSWYRKAEGLARKSENWGGVFAALTHLSALALELQQPAERARLEAACIQLQGEYGEVIYAGPTALPRPYIIAKAHDLLYPEGRNIADVASNMSTDDMLKQATDLRKSKKYQESIPLYLSALASYTKLDQPDSMASCLNGLGISYQMLTKEALLQAKKSLLLEHLEQYGKRLSIEDLEQRKKVIAEAKTPVTLDELLFRLERKDSYELYHLIYNQVGDLAEKERACHRWALELFKEMDDLAEQASQISNLAIIEEILGNLDTARCYQLWAAQAHRKAGALEDAAIDVIDLAYIEECLGDEETGTARRQQAQELRDARKL